MKKSSPSPKESKSKSKSKFKAKSTPENNPNARRSPRFTPPLNNVPTETLKSSKIKATPGTHISLRLSPVSATSSSRNVSNCRRSCRNVAVVSVDGRSLRRSPRSVNACMEIVVSDRNISVGPKTRKKSPKLGNGSMEIVVSKEKDFLKRKRVFDEISKSPRNQNGGLDLQFALVESEKCSSLTVKEGHERTTLNVEFFDEKLLKLSPMTCNSEKSKLDDVFSRGLECCEKGGSESALSRICDSEAGDLGEFEAKPLLLSWGEDGKMEAGVIKCDDEINVSGEEQSRKSPNPHFANENGAGNEFSVKSCQFPLPLNGDGNIEVKSCSTPLSDLMEQLSKRVKTENSDSGMLDGELLRQTPMTDSAVGDETGKIRSANKHSPRKNCGKGRSFEKKSSGKYKKKPKHNSLLIGDPVPSDEAQERWCWRYEIKSKRYKDPRIILDDDDNEDKIVWNVECHYTQADVDGHIINLGDCVYVKGEGAQKHIGRILEFFKTTDREDYFRVQWFYRAEDTVMKEEADFHDKKRLFYSTVMNDNPLDCIISTVSVVKISPSVDLKSRVVPKSGFYYDMEYCVEYSTFRTLPIDCSSKECESPSLHFSEALTATADNTSLKNMSNCGSYKAKLMLLDLFSGCGGMSTGLCLGAKVSCVDLVTRWALDSDGSACESLKLNHPETHVRNDAAEDFLQLLKEWQKLCKRYAVNDVERAPKSRSMPSRMSKSNENSSSDDDDVAPGEFEVDRLVDIRYGKIGKTGIRGLKFKVHWKGYRTSEDSWEPIEGLRSCEESIRNFVREGFRSKILPLPGDVDVICGGPPCQGISGYNRYRNVDSPLADDRNVQIVVFMDIVQFLKPKYILMENVVDILRFDKASLARYALSRLVNMRYQARLGTIAAGCYGLPQFRLRAFLWGAHLREKLPQFPLPSHDVIVRYWPPPEFERNTVAYDENQPRDDLEKAAVLRDAISDLPDVTSHETREEMAYDKPPETDFQHFIRSTIDEMTGSAFSGTTKQRNLLYDHRPYSITEEDYARVCQIPKKKGSNFRDLPGVVVGADNVARRDPREEPMLLPSGKPLVPDFALNFEGGKSRRPYARLWWDETVSTVVTYPDLHSQAVIHPEQDRVLTIRECARLQGFPDYYRFCGTVKQRYRQIGNAVAVPVGRALGYSLGLAFQILSGDDPTMKLPPKFCYSTNLQLAEALVQKTE